jgi:colicin import membrane protein
MQANSPGAVFLSVTFHGLIIALIVFSAYLLRQQAPETPKIFELVAGAGNNYAATEAPAPSTPDKIKFDLPEAPAPVLKPPPPPVKPQPQISKPPPFITPDPAPVMAPPKNVIPEPKPKPVVQKVEPKPKQMSLAEFQKLHGKPKTASTKPRNPRSIKVRSIDANSFANVSSKTLSGAGGPALTREEGRLLDGYIALLLQRLRAAHQKPPGLSDLLKAEVRFNIAADGVLSSVKIVPNSTSQCFVRLQKCARLALRRIGKAMFGP